MRGLWNIAGNPNQIPLNEMASYVRMTMYANNRITGANGAHSCLVDGLAIIGLHDGRDPVVRIGEDRQQRTGSIEQADLGPLGATAWHRPSVVDQANLSAPIREVRVRDVQSGLRRVGVRVGANAGDEFYRPLQPGTVPDTFERRPIRPCTGENADGDPSPTELTSELTWQSEAGDQRNGPCPVSVRPTFDGDRPFSGASDDNAGRHGVYIDATDFALRTTTIAPLPANPLNGPSANQKGWYWIDAARPSCTQLSTSGLFTAATITVGAEDPGFGASPKTGSGLSVVRAWANGRTLAVGGPVNGVFTTASVPRVNLTSGYVVERGRRIATVVVELQDRTGARWTRNVGGVLAPNEIPIAQPSLPGTAVPYPNGGTFRASDALGNQCALRIDLGPDDTKPPTCTPSVISGDESLPRREASTAHAIHVLDPDRDGVATIRVLARDPGWDSSPSVGSGIDTVRVEIGGTTLTRTLDNAERTSGQINFPNVDLARIAGLPAGTSLDEFVVRAQPVLTIRAFLTDRSAAVNLPPNKVGGCQRALQWPVDDVAPACEQRTEVSTQQQHSIHILDPDEDARATVRVYFSDAGSLDDPPTGSGVGAVRLRVNGGAWIERVLNDADRVLGHVNFDNVDVFAGLTASDGGSPIVLAGGETFFSGATTVRLEAQVNDRRILLEPGYLTERRAECERSRTYEAPPAPEAEAVRGADNVVGVWPAVPGVRGYVWTCSRMSSATVLQPLTWFASTDAARHVDLPAGSLNAGAPIPLGRYANTGPCAFRATDVVNRTLRIAARSERFRVLSAERSDTEVVDVAPQFVVAPRPETMPNGDVWTNYWMSENGVVRDFGTTREGIAVTVRDLDGRDDLFGPSDPDERILGPMVVPPSGDYGRIAVTVSRSPGDPHRTEQRAWVVIGLNSDESQITYTLLNGESGVDLATRPLDPNDPDTCVPGGGPTNVIVGPYWVLRCDLIPAWVDHTHAPGQVFRKIVLPLWPREYDEYPLARGERAPANAVANPDKVGPDSLRWRVDGNVRDHRQAADNRYLALFPIDGAPDSSIRQQPGSVDGSGALVIDRVLPTIDLSLSSASDQQTLPIRAVVEDPEPSAVSDPTVADASGLRDLRLELRDQVGVLIDSADAGLACTTPFPISKVQGANRHQRSTCDETLTVPSANGVYSLTGRVRDLATNHREATIEVVRPVAPSTVNAVRGAGGVAAWWNPVYGASGYRYRCTVNSVTGPELTASLDSSGSWRTDLCAGAPGELITIQVTAVGTAGLRGGTASGFERVDRRPVLALDEARMTAQGARGPLGAWASSRNGRIYPNGQRTPRTVIEMYDTDSDLLVPIPPDPHLLDLADRPACTTCVDVPRAAVTLWPNGNGNVPIAQLGDESDAAQLVVQPSVDPAQQLVRLYDGPRESTAWTQTLSSVAVDTCLAGDTGKVVTSQPNGSWKLDCATLSFERRTDGVRVSADVVPVDLGDPSVPRYRTRDQGYQLAGTIRDQRQAADHRFLTNEANSSPDADSVAAYGDAAVFGYLFLDRVLPRLNANSIAETGPVLGPEQHTIQLNIADPLDATTDPSGVITSGVLSARVTGGWVDPATDTVTISIVNAGASCTPPLPLPLYQVPVNCTATTSNLPASGTYRYTIELIDHSGNNRSYELEAQYTLPQPAPNSPASVTAIAGARGIGAYLSPVANATGYLWECVRTSSGVIVASGAALQSGAFWRTDLCPGSPSEQLTFRVRSVGPGGFSAATTNATARVDERPSIANDPDPDGSTSRLDSVNGPVYSTGTTNRAIRYRLTDDGDLHLAPETSAVFTGIPERPTPIRTDDAMPRSVIAIRPPAGRPDAPTAYVVIQHNGTQPGNVRRIALVDGTYTGDLATASMSGATLGGFPICNPTSNPIVLQTQHWRLDCARAGYVSAASNDLRISLPVEPLAAAPDQTYSVSGWVRDSRQLLDNRYLSSDVSGAYDQGYTGAATVDLGTLTVDRVQPVGSTDIAESAGTFQLIVDDAHDVLPNAATAPTTFDATGLARVTVRVEGANVLLETDLTCTPAPPRTADAASNCTRSYTPLAAGVNTAVFTVYDVAGNRTTYTRTFGQAPPTQAPDVTLVRASTGVVAKWAPISGVTGYEWSCENVTGSVTSTQTSTSFYNSPSAAIVHSPVCNANLANTSGKLISVRVRAFVGTLPGPWSTVQSLFADTAPSAVISAPPHNLSTPNDVSTFVLTLSDPNGDLLQLSSPDPDLSLIQDPDPAGDRPRAVLKLTGGVAASALHAVIELGPANQPRLVRFYAGTPPGGSLSGASLSDSDADTCQPASAETIVTTYWFIDCAGMSITTSGTTFVVSIPIRLQKQPNGDFVTRDFNMGKSVDLRDMRQPGDNRFLQYTPVTSTHYVDHIVPEGTISATGSGTSSSPGATLAITARDVPPSATTNPTGDGYSFLGALAVRTERLVGGSWALVSDFQGVAEAQCNGPIAGFSGTRTCSVPRTGLDPSTTYRFTLRVTDRAGNARLVTPIEYTTPSASGGPAGTLDTTYAAGGFAITQFGTQNASVGSSVQLANGNTLTIGTRSGNTIAMTSHTPTGAAATSFGTGGVATYTNTIVQKANAVTIDSSGRILVAAEVFVAFRERVAVFRFFADGTLDTSFGTNGYVVVIPDVNSAARVADIQFDSQGRIVIGGTLQTFTNQQKFYASRVTSNGVVDTSFGTAGTASSTYPGAFTVVGGYLALRSDDSVLVAGNTFFTTPLQMADRNATVVAFSSAGALDTPFGGGDGWFLSKPEGNPVTVREITMGSDGTATLGLACESGCGFGIARINVAGELDTTFGTGNDGSTFLNVSGTWTQDYDMVPTAGGLYIVVGRSGTAGNATPNLAIARFDDDGAVDPGFGTNGYTVTTVPAGSVETMSATQAPTGNLIVAGTLTPPTGAKRFLLASYFT